MKMNIYGEKHLMFWILIRPQTQFSSRLMLYLVNVIINNVIRKLTFSGPTFFFHASSLDSIKSNSDVSTDCVLPSPEVQSWSQSRSQSPDKPTLSLLRSRSRQSESTSS